MDPFFHTQIGDVRVTAVLDTTGRIPPVEFLAGAPADEVRALAGDELREDGTLPISFHTFLLESVSEGATRRILVDTCLGEHDLPIDQSGPADLPRSLVRAGVERERVDVVVQTHLHVDHVGWNTMQFWPHSSADEGETVPMFPNARHLVHEREWAYWVDGEGASLGAAPDYERHLRPLVRRKMVDRMTEERRELTPEVSVELVAGHTPGHLVVCIDSAGERGYVIGDALHLPLQVARPEWSSRADVDGEAAAEARRGLLDRIAGEDALLLSGHFGFPGIGRVAGAEGERRFEAL